MRIVWSVSLVLLFLANTIGSISLLFIHRHEMRELIRELTGSENSSADLTTLTFSDEESNQLIWFKADHEFRYNNHMYDVIKKENKEDGCIVYHCIKDEKENEIYKDIFEELNAPSPGQNEDCSIVLQLFKFLSELQVIPSSYVQGDRNVNLKNGFTYLESFHQVYLSIACEPPDPIS